MSIDYRTCPDLLKRHAYWMAANGLSCFDGWWSGLAEGPRKSLVGHYRRLKAIAAEADMQMRGRRRAA